MDDPCVNHYEKQLYSVFKSFDVNNEESLDEPAVHNLCDALQLEERGAALVDALFERRAGRVTFAQFRSGLLAVLGEPPAAPPAEPPPHSDEEASAREVAPKFVFGYKKYGRRSRPQVAAALDGRASPRAASASRLEADDRRSLQRPLYRRSSSAMDRREDESAPPQPALEHDRLIDRDEALALCRSLHMHSIDRRLVERIFEESPKPETTVGEFFDLLNSSLASTMEDSRETETTSGGDSADDDDKSGVAAERVAEAWEAVGVRRPRRLLAELGFAGGAAVRPPALERALDDELRAFDSPLDERATLLAAALALARLRAAAARRRCDTVTAERDKLRADLAEANRHARMLALEVDESHGRIENELKASLKRAEARHTEELRRAAAEMAAERERFSAERARLEAEAARRSEAEGRLRGAAEESLGRADELEGRALAAEERAEAAERECARLAERLRAAEARGAGASEAAGAAAALAARADELQRENQRLRDRADELCAALEASARPGAAAAQAAGARGPAAPGGDLSAELRSMFVPNHSEGTDSAPDSIDASGPAERGAQAEAPAGTGAQAEAPAGSGGGAENGSDDEKQKLAELVKELEGSLEAMRGEYEACEEYWGGKLAEERAAADAEQRAADERLADLAARIGDFERRLAPPAPALAPIPEAAALEAQVADLEAEFARYRRDAEARLRAARRRGRTAAPAPAPPPPAPCGRCRRLEGALAAARGAELAARCARAEAGVRRLHARLAAADLLVKDLYVENCQLAHRRPL